MLAELLKFSKILSHALPLQISDMFYNFWYADILNTPEMSELGVGMNFHFHSMAHANLYRTSRRRLLSCIQKF